MWGRLIEQKFQKIIVLGQKILSHRQNFSENFHLLTIFSRTKIPVTEPIAEF